MNRRTGWLSVVACVLMGAGVWWFSFSGSRTFEGPAVELADLPEPIAAALRAAEKRARQSPGSAEAWGHWGMVCMAHDLLPQAMKCLERAEKLDPRSFRWPYYRGMCLVFDDSTGALAAFARAVELKPDLPVLRIELAERLLTVGRLDEAEAHLSHPSVPPDEPRVNLARGHLAFARGNWPESRRRAESVIAELPDNREAHELLSRVCLRLDDPDTAAEHARRCRELGSRRASWPDPLMIDVVSLCRAPSQLLLQAGGLSAQGEYEQAGQLLRRVLKLSPDDPEALVQLGFVLLQQGDRAGAEQVLGRAVAVSSRSAEARYYLGSLRASERRWEQAIELLRAALVIKPDYAAARFNLGECLRQTGDAAQAIAEFRAALQAQPGLVACRLSLAELLLNRGEQAAAREHLEMARRIAPDNERLKKLLSRLDQE